MLAPNLKRRGFIAGVATAAATMAVNPIAAATSSKSVKSSKSSSKSFSGLAEPAFRPLPLGSISPEGWLRRQLKIQAAGLTGHLDEFWPDVGQSKWFGGKAEGWERAPYWMDGAIPLAWIVGDEKLKARLTKYVDHIVENQRTDGWYAPYPADASAKSYDVWSILLANKVLVQYHEATNDSKVLQAVTRNLKAMHQVLDKTPLFGWGKFRWFEGLISVFYVYEKSGEAWLLDLARKLYEQSFDYMGFYATEDVTQATPRRGLWRWDKHVVNTAMAIKAYALSWRLSRKDFELAFPARMLDILDRYHGQVNGMFTGDECLSGKNPLQGTELCAVVETMYSLEQVLAVSGSPSYADRLERIAFNALPATYAPDMWSHQYDQQVNQAQCTINPDYLWSTNHADSNIYGLEPNFGCCTANMHQGWPKFAAHLWMRTPNQGLAAIAYAPCTVRFESKGVPVCVSVETDYPFRDTVKISVRPDKEIRFPLMLRAPEWAKGATVCVDNGAERAMKAGAFYRVERSWSGSTDIVLKFPMQVKTTKRYNSALAIERGPLVYSLKIGEKWTRVNADKPYRELPHGDFEVTPTTPWNYGLIVDELHPEKSITFEERGIGEVPFSPEGAGVMAKVKGKKLPNWKIAAGWAGEIQPDIQSSREPVEDVTLIPYGCTNIRITEFPRVRK